MSHGNRDFYPPPEDMTEEWRLLTALSGPLEYGHCHCHAVCCEGCEEGACTCKPHTDDCIDCNDPKAEQCPMSERLCGHHCNHSWTHDICDWCKKEWTGDCD